MKFLEGEQQEQRKYNGIREEIVYKSLIRDRTIYLYDDIDDDAEILVNYFLDRFCKPEKNGEKKSIKLKISTNGGDAFAAFSIVSAMESAIEKGYEVETYSYGRIFSAGTIIAASGSKGKRFLQRNTRYLLHDLNSLLFGHVTSEEILRISSDMKDVLGVYKKILMEKTKVSSKIFDSHVTKISDWQFWADEAIKYGLADKKF